MLRPQHELNSAAPTFEFLQATCSSAYCLGHPSLLDLDTAAQLVAFARRRRLFAHFTVTMPTGGQV